MFKKLRRKIAGRIFPDYIKEALDTRIKALEFQLDLEKQKREMDNTVNRRVAATIAQMDPFYPIMKEFDGVFSRQYERVEDPLNEQGKISMYMWAHHQAEDVHFNRMIDWVMNKSGNSIMKKDNPTELQFFYKRAEIANMILLRKEVGRLSSNYEDVLKKNKGENEKEDGEVD